MYNSKTAYLTRILRVKAGFLSQKFKLSLILSYMDKVIDQNSLVTVESGSLAFEKFNQKLITPFFERSVSGETRRAYRQVVKQFFIYWGATHIAGYFLL